MKLFLSQTLLMKENLIPCSFILILLGSLVLSVITNGPYFGYIMAIIIFGPLLFNIYFKLTQFETKQKNISKPLSKSILGGDNLVVEQPKSKLNFSKFVIASLIFFTFFTCGTRKRIGAVCNDGTGSSAIGSGACSYHMA